MDPYKFLRKPVCESASRLHIFYYLLFPTIKIVGEGRLYHLYFLDPLIDVNSKTFTLTATHQGTGENVKLYEWEIQNNMSGAKFGIDKKGLWRLNVTIDGQQYASFFVEVK